MCWPVMILSLHEIQTKFHKMSRNDSLYKLTHDMQTILMFVTFNFRMTDTYVASMETSTPCNVISLMKLA
jgi:hypothetical protein